MSPTRVFAGVMHEDQESRLLESCTRLEVRERERIITRGEPGNDMFIVHSGSFKVIDESAGEDFVLTILKPGDVFGEMSFIDGMPRSATVVSMESGALLRLGPEEFERLRGSDESAATALLFALARLVVRRLRKTDEALLFMANEEEGRPDEEKELQSLIREMSRAVHEELSKEGLTEEES